MRYKKCMHCGYKLSREGVLNRNGKKYHKECLLILTERQARLNKECSEVRE